MARFLKLESRGNFSQFRCNDTRAALLLSCIAAFLVGPGRGLAQTPASDFPPGTWWQQDQQILYWQLDQDPDGDGVTTRDEYHAGTDPLSAASKLDLRLERDGAGVSLLWNSVPGARYGL